MSLPRVLAWCVRALWATLAVGAGPAFAEALHTRSDAVKLAASVALWAVWAAVLCATLVLHPLSLTITRLAAPLAVLGAVIASTAGTAFGWQDAAALVTTVAITLLAFVPETAMAYVNGTAYPNERRFPLRAPGPLLMGPIAVAWTLTTVVPSGAVLLLAAKQWIAGGALVAIGGVAVFVLGRSLHSLARRWLVFVPAGMVVHDPLTLADPVLFPRAKVASLGPAPAGADALDLTARAFGLALQLDLTDPATLALVRAGSRAVEQATTTKLLVTPTRPGAVLAEARARRIP